MRTLAHVRTLPILLALVVAPMALGEDDPAKNQKANLIQASTAIGMNIENTSGEKLGDIHDLAINTADGRCHYVIVSRGGLAGVGDTLNAVPWQALTFGTPNDPARLDITKERFEQAPRFDNNNWNMLGDRSWCTTVNTYYGVKADLKADKSKDAATTTPTYMKGSAVVGMDLHNRQDEDLGEVEDLMIDTKTGRIGYAVLGFGGVMGMGEKLFAVPWQALNYNNQAKQFVLDVDKDKLKTAPGFDKDNWPDMTDVRWSKDIHTFYGSDPNWIYGYSGGEDRSAGGWGVDSEYNRMFRKGSVETFKGYITDVGTMTPMQGMEAGAQITIQIDKETLPVHLGPQWFMERQGNQFNKGEEVEVSGSRVEINGAPAIIATEIKRGDAKLRLRDKDGRPCWAAWHADKD